MPLVKRDKSGNFLESYEIKNFRVDLDEKTILVNLVKHIVSSSGVPSSEPSVFKIQNFKRLETEKVESETSIAKRNADGSIIMDEKGNPVLESSVIVLERPVYRDVQQFSEIATQLTTGESLYKEIQNAIYSSLLTYNLGENEDFKIE